MYMIDAGGIVSIITAATALVAAVAALVTVLRTTPTLRQVKARVTAVEAQGVENHNAMNSRLSELLTLAKKLARAEGFAEGRETTGPMSEDPRPPSPPG